MATTIAPQEFLASLTYGGASPADLRRALVARRVVRRLVRQAADGGEQRRGLRVRLRCRGGLSLT
jgi:hypothetical protein